MKFIYQLKNPDTRTNFILGLVRSNYDAQLEELFRAVCLIKDNQLEPALELIRLTNLNHINQCARQELMDLCELIAVLWAQREETGTLNDTEKAKVLHSIFELLGGYDFFRNKDADLESRQQEYKIFSYTYSKTPSPKRIFFYMRPRWGDNQSRLHELPAVLKAVFSIAGAECHVQHSDNPKNLAELQYVKNSLIIIDVQWCGLNESLNFAEKTRGLGNKVIGIFTDFHYLSIDTEQYVRLELLDIVWAPSCSSDQYFSLIKLKNFTDFPVPSPVDSYDYPSLKNSSLNTTPFFIGSVERNNLPRIYFYIMSVLFKKYGFDISSHVDDGLSAWESYSQYLQRLNKHDILLSFSLRYSGLRTAVGKNTEALALGKLLLLEFTPQFRRWYSPNEHFLEFSTPEELGDLCNAIRESSINVKEVARAGYLHYSKHYAPNKLIMHFNSIL